MARMGIAKSQTALAATYAVDAAPRSRRQVMES
jgi:hypothetical protein